MAPPVRDEDVLWLAEAVAGGFEPKWERRVDDDRPRATTSQRQIGT
jgi:hypothetical protein